MSNPLSVKPLMVDDFSGGMTDYYKGNNDTTQFQVGDNKLIDDNKKLVTRPGSELYDDTAPRLTQLDVKVSDAVSVQDVVYQHSGRQLNYILASTMTEVTGPTSNKVFASGDEDSKGSFAKWNDQLFCASDEYSPTQRVYKNESAAVKVNNLGLPYVELFGAIRLANELRTDYIAHIADTGEHTAGADGVNTLTSPASTDYYSLITLTNELLTKYAAHRADAALAVPLYHAAQSTANALTLTTSATTLDEAIERLEHLKIKFNAHDADSTAHGTDTAHQVTSLVLPNATGTAGAQSFIYAIYYAHSYYVGDVLYKETGPVTFVEANSLNAPNTNAITLNNLLPLVNGTRNNWDTTNIRLEVARTTNGGDTFYYHSDQLASTTSFVDTLSDTDLQLNPPLYTEGGILDNEPPPEAKYIQLVNDTLVSMNVKEGSVIRSNRARFSKRFKPFSNPSEFFMDFDSEIVGGGPINVYPIIFLANKCYRLEGFYDENGAGGYQKREISTRIGCISNRSIVVVQDGLLFASEDGFYFTDGFKVTKVSKAINETYSALHDKEDICATYDLKKNIILWGVKTDSASQTNDRIFVAHANYIRPNEDLPFTSWSGGDKASNFSASCLAYIDGFVLRGDHRGYLFKHSDDVLTDLNIEAGTDVDTWYTRTIIYDYRSNAYDFGAADKRKWVSKIVINADNETSLALAIESNNDNSGVFRELKPIDDRGNIEWGDGTLIWGDASLKWNYFPVISAWRRFPAQGLRCQYKQVRLTNAYTLIDDDMVIGNVETDSIAKTATLLDGDFEFLTDAAGYFVSFANDDYAEEFPITAVSGGELTLEDDEDRMDTLTDSAWKIQGYRKREVLNLLNYVIHFDYVTTTQAAYRNDPE
jgi:hypothetical protein